MHLFVLSKKKKETKKRSLFPVDNCNVNVGVTIKVLNRLKNSTLVFAKVSSGTEQLGIDF